MESVNSWLRSNSSGPSRVHLGCGSKYLKGWCNVDFYPSSDNEEHRGSHVVADVWADLLSIEIDQCSVDEFLASHVFEHFYRHELLQLTTKLYEALKPGGILVAEMPDLRRLVHLSAFLPRRPKQAGKDANRDLVMSQFYGAAWENNSDLFPYHKYIWEKAEFAEELHRIGFEVLLLTNATLSHQPGRDFACIAQKPALNSSALRTELVEQRLRAYGGKLERFSRQARNIARLFITGTLGR